MAAGCNFALSATKEPFNQSEHYIYIRHHDTPRALLPGYYSGTSCPKSFYCQNTISSALFLDLIYFRFNVASALTTVVYENCSVGFCIK